MVKLVDKCYSKAIEVLKKNSTDFGFKASFKFYNSIWARDGAVTILGATSAGDEKLLETSYKTLKTLKKYQTPLGQIPNAFLLDKKTPTYYATDANSWWVIGAERYFSAIRGRYPTEARKFLSEFWPSVKLSVSWLKYQIKDRSGLLDVSEASDWMDSSIGRRGKVFYTNCLYWKAIDSANKLAKAAKEKEFDPAPYSGEGAEDLKELKRRINLVFWPEEKGKEILDVWRTEFFEEAVHPLRKHYINYLSFEYIEDRCDVLAHSLAIIFGIPDRERRQKILKYLSERKVSNPYPVKVLNPPVFYPNPTWNPRIY